MNTEKTLSPEMVAKMAPFSIDPRTGLVEHKSNVLHDHFEGPAGRHYANNTPIFVPGHGETHR